MTTSTPNVTLKAAANRLGVHEQTLRSWERRGLIRMIRLPGSGYRRVPVQGIERLEEEMAAEITPSGVRIIPPRLDTESQAQAKQLASEIRATIAQQEGEQPGMSFDEWLEYRRGRQWSE